MGFWWDFNGTSMGLQQARLSWDMKGALQVVAFDRDRWYGGTNLALYGDNNVAM